MIEMKLYAVINSKTNEIMGDTTHFGRLAVFLTEEAANDTMELYKKLSKLCEIENSEDLVVVEFIGENKQ